MLFVLFLIMAGISGVLGYRMILGLAHKGICRPQTFAFEDLSGIGLVAIISVLGLSWCLSMLRLLTSPALISGCFLLATIFAYIGVRKNGSVRNLANWLLVVKGRPGGFLAALGNPPGWLLFCMVLPFMLWVLFAVWRGFLLGPQNHDALAYHFPKAAFICQLKGYAFFGGNDLRIASSGANYELILADSMILWGNDRSTALISTCLYVIFIFQAMGIAERWWGRGLHVAALGLLVAGMPLCLLQASAHKNDLMTSFFTLAALHWLFRWLYHPRPGFAVLGILALCSATGTKLNAALLVPALAFVVLIHFCRKSRYQKQGSMGKLALVSGTFIGGQVLLGGQTYLLNLIHSGDLAGIKRVQSFLSQPNNIVPHYGDWGNYLRWPFLVLEAPFSRNPLGVWVPWRSEYWFWPRYELFSSHWGILVSILFILLPVLLLYFKKGGLFAGPPLRERLPMTIAVMLYAALLIPIGFKTLGFFNAYGRYLMIIPIFIALWSLCPLLICFENRGIPWGSKLFLVGLSANLAFGAIEFGSNDRFAPLPFVVWAAEHPGNRVSSFSQSRAGSVVDQMAGPRDVIAFDGGPTDAWIYPAFGKCLSRKVILLEDSNSALTIPAEASWVVIDRSWNIIWEHPEFTNMGKFASCINRGTPSGWDLKTISVLIRDPDWQLVYALPRLNQAVFKRKAAVSTGQ